MSSSPAPTPLSPSNANSVEALILGAGWSGVLTALRLAEAGRKVVLIEARERVGGRAFTHTYDENSRGNGDRTVPGKKSWGAEAVEAVDLGCSWIHGYYEGNPVKGICEKLNIPVSVAKPGKELIIGPSGPLSEELQQRITSNLSTALSSAHSLARSLKTSSGASLGHYLLRYGSPLFEGLSQEHHLLAQNYARKLQIPLGFDLDSISLRWFGFEQNFAGTDAAPEGGFTRVIDALVARFVEKGGRVITGQEVRKVQSLPIPEQETRVKVVTTSGEYEAPVAVCTFPLAVLQNEQASVFEPALSERKRRVIDLAHVCDLDKVVLVYDSPWWEKDIGTFTILSDPPVGRKCSDVTFTFSTTNLTVAADYVHSRLVVLIGGSGARVMEMFPRAEIAKDLHTYLTSKMPIALAKGEEVPRPSHNFLTRWSEHKFTGGATTAPSFPDREYSPLDFVELSRPEYDGHLLFAGEHTELHHRGSVAGAVVSAEREAARALVLLQKL